MEEIVLIKSEIILPPPKVVAVQEDNDVDRDINNDKEPAIKKMTGKKNNRILKDKYVNVHPEKNMRSKPTYQYTMNKNQNVDKNIKNEIIFKKNDIVQAQVERHEPRMQKPLYRKKDEKKKKFSWLKSFFGITLSVCIVSGASVSYKYVKEPIELIGAVAMALSYPQQSISQVSSYINGIGQDLGNKDSDSESTNSYINNKNNENSNVHGSNGYQVIDYLQGSQVESNDSSEKDVDDNLSKVDTPDQPEDSEVKQSKNDGTVSVVNYKSISSDNVVALENGHVKNLSHLSNKEVLEIASKKPKLNVKKNDDPQVLIMHTHATESFLPNQSTTFDSKQSFRTTNNEKNMVAVGEQIAQELNAAGIKTIQDDTQHDYPSYTGSYERSAVTVKKYLKKYPSIKIVLDVHRDAIAKSNKDIVAAVAEVDGKEAAQVMIISGCDNGSMNMPKYKENLKFASLLQNEMEKMYPGLTRPILFDYRKYNQDLTTGSILLEVGSHGNTYEQVEYSGKLIGKALASVFS